MKKKLKYIIMTGVLAVSMMMGCGKEEDRNIILGQYKGLTLYEVESSVIADEMREMMESYAELVPVERAAAEGDTVNINYVGTKDGVAFPGGTYDKENGYDLKLGSDTFVDGFEDGLIGAVAGEVRELDVTFPETYGNAELAGQKTVFTVTINTVKESVVPELTDKFVKENIGFSTTAEYVVALYNKRNKESFYEQITKSLMESSTVKTLPAEVVEKEKQSFREYYLAQAEYYGSRMGMAAETALLNLWSFGTMETFESYCEEYANDVVKNMLVLAEIATMENLTLSSEEYESRALVYAYNYGYEDVATFEEEYGKDALLEAVTSDYIMDYIISQAVIVKDESDGDIQQMESSVK